MGLERKGFFMPFVREQSGGTAPINGYRSLQCSDQYPRYPYIFDIIKSSGSITKGQAIAFDNSNSMYKSAAFEANCKDFSTCKVVSSFGDGYIACVLVSSQATKLGYLYPYSENSNTLTIDVSDYDYIALIKENPQSYAFTINVTFN